MSKPKQLDEVEKMYTDNILQKGMSSEAVGWNTDDCQNLRFEKLSSFIIESYDYSVNDYGCGFGSHLKYLTETLEHKVNSYNGYDLSQEMLDSAKINLQDYKGNLNFIKSFTIQTSADYSFVSGTFNVCFDANKENWKEFIVDTLSDLNKYSKKGFSFNMLTSYVDWEESHLYYGDPLYWFDFCKKNFSSKVSLLHDYPLWEWTINVRKD